MKGQDMKEKNMKGLMNLENSFPNLSFSASSRQIWKS